MFAKPGGMVRGLDFPTGVAVGGTTWIFSGARVGVGGALGWVGLTDAMGLLCARAEGALKVLANRPTITKKRTDRSSRWTYLVFMAFSPTSNGVVRPERK